MDLFLFLDKLVQKGHDYEAKHKKSLSLLIRYICIAFILIMTTFLGFYAHEYDLFKCELAFILTYLANEKIYRRIKVLFFKITIPSFLQDFLFFFTPCYFLFAFLFNSSMSIASDYLGIISPLFLAFYRLTCFFHGCCYGKAVSKWGVLYPEKVWKRYGKNCSTVEKREKPVQRVFPIQLIEAFFNILIFFFLISFNAFHGSSLLYFLFSYSIFRFFADFFRKTSFRPRYGPFSEAQVICLILVGVFVTYLML